MLILDLVTVVCVAITAQLQATRARNARLLQEAIARANYSLKQIALDFGLDKGQCSRQLSSGRLMADWRSLPLEARRWLTTQFAHEDGLILASDIADALIAAFAARQESTERQSRSLGRTA